MASEQSTTIGVPKERRPGEKRVALVPETVPKLQKLGFQVVVETGAGENAGFADQAYVDSGAEIIGAAGYREDESIWSADIVVKVGVPDESEVARLQKTNTLVGLLFPASNEDTVNAIAASGASAIALDRVPRISRAQKMDVLSSMANIAGYRAVLEASQTYQGFFGPQVTAAGTDPPAKVLIIGAGVAGLAAIAAARALGAEVRAFDVRPATKEQCESLGARFLMLEFEESGEGEGGYAKTMSKEFIDAEMALFAEQAKEVDVIVTTALIPGKKAPVLITKPMVESMKTGSVVVDLAAEQGGNCEVTQAGQHVRHQGVNVLGFTDLTSRMAHTASRFYSGNLYHLLAEMCADEGYQHDLENEVVRAATIVHQGEILPPPPRAPAPPKAEPAQPAIEPKPAAKNETPSNTGPLIGGAIALALLAVVGRYAPEAFVQHFTVFILACFVGWQVVWSVTAALHTPLMSVTNAISGIILVGGMLQAGSGRMDLAAILGAVALLVATINVAGGFLVTQRMLKMFRRGGDS